MSKQEGNKRLGFVMTKNTKHVSDSGIDETRQVTVPRQFGQKFRLLDDDDQVYFYGYMYNGEQDFDEFTPLDYYGASYGCTDLQYQDKDGKWKVL